MATSPVSQKNRTQRRRDRRPSGFTLVELLVSIALFSVVVLIVAGAISSIINVNKKAQTITSVVNNLNFTLESMTRAIKTGTDLQIGDVGFTGTCADSVSVTDAQGRAVTYSYLPPSVDEGGSITIAVSTVNGGAPSPLTAPEINVVELRFCDLAGEQPGLIFTVDGSMDLVGGISSDFHVQSTVAQRALLLPSN
jgi:prepilin-type N-terminal cleavage/methylation domain-containing protein